MSGTEGASTLTSSPPAPRWLVPVLLLGAALLAVVVSLLLAGGAYTPAPDGLPDPGPLVGWGLPVVRVIAVVASLLTVGWLLAAAVLDPPGRKGAVSAEGRADLIRASWAAGVWALASVALMALTFADIVGLPLADALAPKVVSTYAWDLPQVRSLALAAVIALLVLVEALASTSTGSAAVLLVLTLVGVSAPTLTGHAGGLGDHALATTSGIAHVVSASVWVGGLAALVLYAVRRGRDLRPAAESFGQVAMVCVLLLAVSGVANAYTRMNSFDELVTTGYGRLVLVKVVLLLGLLLIAARVRRVLVPRLGTTGGGRAFVRVALLEVTVMALAIGVGVALARTPGTRVSQDLTTPGETLLGYPFPPEPTWVNVMLGWHPDVLMLTGCLLAAGLYLAGVLRLHRRGDRWPVGRTVSWVLGVSAVLWVTNAGIAAYAPAIFSLHMVQHMFLAMMAPILLVLGGPTTLALRAIRPSPYGRRGPREWLVWALNTPLTRFITHPIFVLVIYTLGLYGLYFTPLFGFLMGSHVGHVAMQLHFIAAGYLFYWVVIGIDPTPRPVPYWGKLLLLILSLVIHSFFAVPILLSGAPIAEDWYGLVRPPWMLDPLADTKLGGGIAWAFGEIPTFVVLIALSWQWARSDARDAARYDRKADRDGDRELNDYNARLAAMNVRDESAR